MRKLLGQHKLSLCNTFRISNALSVQQSKSVHPQFPCKIEMMLFTINVLCRTVFMYYKVFMLWKYSALLFQVAVLTSALNYHNYFQKVFLKTFHRKINHSIIENTFYVASNVSGDRCKKQLILRKLLKVLPSSCTKAPDTKKKKAFYKMGKHSKSSQTTKYSRSFR